MKHHHHHRMDPLLGQLLLCDVFSFCGGGVVLQWAPARPSRHHQQMDPLMLLVVVEAAALWLWEEEGVMNRHRRRRRDHKCHFLSWQPELLLEVACLLKVIHRTDHLQQVLQVLQL